MLIKNYIGAFIMCDEHNPFYHSSMLTLAPLGSG